MSNCSTVSLDEAIEIFKTSQPENYFIYGWCNSEVKHVILLRGDLKVLYVPFDYFTSGPSVIKPDFNDFEIIDNGLTLRLGKFEAGTDAILYEFDESFRKRMVENERK